jgi:hypothetical protein
LLAICQFTSQILVYPGLADGAFGLPVATKLPAPAFEGTLFLEAASAGIGGTAADFNGDGKLDLLILLTRDLSGLASPVINAYFLPGNGDGSFGQAVQVQRGVAAVALASADFNGDGKPDYAYLTLTISENAMAIKLPVRRSTFSSETATDRSVLGRLMCGRAQRSLFPL